MRIYELRRYALRPGRREDLIGLFEREFVESQEAAGMRVAGTFRDPDAPDTFPWLRAFPDMAARKAALETFYSGPVWRAHREAANATMLDSDDVLLLRALAEPPLRARPPVGADAPPASRYVATVYPVADGFPEFFDGVLAPVLAEAGVPPVVRFVTEHAENTFPQLPVREGENVFVWFARFDGPAGEGEPDAVDLDTVDLDAVDLPVVAPRLTAAPQRLRLHPTARSAMR
ncbi:NIPSNAP family protein [Nonomuraea sp. NPDC050783]|uniref:NIPSNAP family protein n=1 Tax=Nonomuraea sp. NPDC050783 TaxID=3154634 RepID=UPI00346734A8